MIVEITSGQPYERDARWLDVNRITKLRFSANPYMCDPFHARPECAVRYMERATSGDGEYELEIQLVGPQVEALVLALQAAKAAT